MFGLGGLLGSVTGGAGGISPSSATGDTSSEVGGTNINIGSPGQYVTAQPYGVGAALSLSGAGDRSGAGNNTVLMIGILGAVVILGAGAIFFTRGK